MHEVTQVLPDNLRPSLKRLRVRHLFITILAFGLVGCGANDSDKEESVPTPTVIPPFLLAARSRAQLANASFCFGVIPPRPILGRS